MASNYTNLGVQLMTTGEKAGTWGTLTNTNWNIIEQISGGYTTQALPDNGTTALVKSDGATGATLATRIWKLTGTLSAGNSVLTVPDSIENWWLINNAEGGSTYTVTVKTVSGTGVAWAAGETGYKLLFSDGTNVVDSGFSDTHGDVTLTGTQTLTNKTLTAPAIGTSILDTNGLELALITATGSAVNEFTIANAAAGAGPTLSATGDESNVDINLNPKGSGVLKSGTAAVQIAGTETMWIPANALYLPTTNPADAASVETTAIRPELKVLDFDAGTAQYAQFAIGMPKSWNLGTVTYQVFWSPSNTDTGDCIFGLQGVSCSEGDTADVAFGTAIEVTDAGIGTVEDVQMSAVSSAMTIAGSPADDDQTFFQLYRDAADVADDFTGEARVLGIKLFYTTDAANDA
jgi:hypothetical protein